MKEDEANEIKDLVSVIYKKSLSNTKTYDNTEKVHLDFLPLFFFFKKNENKNQYLSFICKYNGSSE